jgi:type II secretory pathway component GspD/PulD (secretin)
LSSKVCTSRRQRRIAALAVAVALASPLTDFSRSRALAQDAGEAVPAALLQQQAPNNEELLRRGVDEYKSNRYEEAQTLLQQVNAEQLSDRDRRTLTDTLSRAESAANERRAARAAFEQGQQALANNNPGEAVQSFRAAADNKYADEGTRAKAREQIALAQDAQRRALGDMRQVYNEAKRDYRDGNHAEARQKFVQLDAAGFSAPMFDKSPRDFVRDIDRQSPQLAQTQQQPAQPQVQAPVAQEPVAQAPTEPQPQAQAQPQQPPPQLEPAAPAAQPQQVEATNDRDRRNEARAAYQDGRRQYEQRDFAGARASFQRAEQLGYRPGLFEDAPERYLRRIDQQEQAQARRQQEPPAQVDQAQPAQPAQNAQQRPQTLEATAQIRQTQTQQSQFEAAQLVQQAQAAREQNRLEDALAAYTEAANIDPNNQEAQAGRREMLRLTGREAAPGGLLERVARDMLARREQIRFNFQEATQNADTAIQRNNFVEAQRYVQAARVARNQDPLIFNPEEIREFDTRIADTQLALDQSRQRFQQQMADEAAVRAAREDQLRQQQIQEQTRRTVADLIRRSRTAVNEGRYEEALGVIDQILILEPNNDYAVGVRPLVEDRALFHQQRMYREDFDRQLTKSLNQAEEKRIPYTDILRYPENWPDLSAVREESVRMERGDEGEDAAMQQILDRRIADVRFADVAFDDVLEYFRDVTQANIWVNWRALETTGIDQSAPVTARLTNVRFRTALETVLDFVGGGLVDLGYSVDDGVIRISTLEELQRNTVTRVYDIRDMIIDIPDYTAPQFDLDQDQGQSSGRGGGGGQGGGSLFGGAGGTTSLDEQDRGPTRLELVDSIISLIQDTVAPDSWREMGGTVGSIRELSGQLIVTQTAENQRELTRLLSQLRETRAIQVTVEARFLTVQRNFLEDVGIDFDFTFNNQDPGDPNRRFSPITVSQNSSEFTAAGNVDTALPGSLGGQINVPALSTNFTFIDDFTASFLIRATQANVMTSQVQAPRVTLFNGQRAFVVVATERSYVSDLTPVVGQSAVGQDPTISRVWSGVVLDVSATVSADRKYVTLNLRPTLRRLLALETFELASSIIIPGGTVGTPTTPITQTSRVQQPITQITQVRTSVSVPDGGTLLLGGQTLSGETEREMGVPVVSKIPFLKRLFTNRSMAKDEQILLILVKPTIIIQREIEQQQFPLLNTRPRS